jgi:hypothetical protein
MNTVQQGDVLIYQSIDNGNMNIEDGITEMTQSVESMIYLALVGGNQEDNNTPATDHLQWMGNEDEEPQFQYRSKFQAWITSGKPITSGTLKEGRDAATDDITSAFGDMLKAVICNVQAKSQRHVSVYSDIVLSDETAYTIITEVTT